MARATHRIRISPQKSLGNRLSSYQKRITNQDFVGFDDSIGLDRLRIIFYGSQGYELENENSRRFGLRRGYSSRVIH